jgi:hypothetical protein
VSSQPLFPVSIPIPEWLPDETLFSLLSRIHQIWGSRRCWQTTLQLFGCRGIGYQHDFPGHLSQLVQRIGLVSPYEFTLASRKTLLNYYRLFLSVEEEHALATTMCNGHVPHLKMQLGILTSRFRANHPLKACPECIRQDIAEYGWAYWHMNHQYPGVWICTKHDQPLQTSSLKSTGVGRFDWHLPSIPTMAHWDSALANRLKRNLPYLRSLSIRIIELVSQADVIRLNHIRIQRAYLPELSRRGWLTHGGHLKLSQLGRAFLEYANHLRFIPEMSALPESDDEAKIQLGRLLRSPRTGTHPIRHLMIIDWLYPQLETFLADYQSAGQLTFSKVHGDQTDGASNKRQQEHQQLQDLILKHRFSLRAAARYLGIDVGTAMLWAGKQGIRINRRPKFISDDVRCEVIAKLRDGKDKQIIADSLQISLSSVTRVLLTEPGLQLAWHQTRKERKRIEIRQHWLALLARYAASGVKIMRSMNPAAYVWLYRNDKAWLLQHVPAALSQKNNDSPRLRWDLRDELLHRQIKQAVLKLREANVGLRKIRLWQLYQEVPELKAKLSVLDRLPLTKGIIEQVLSRDLRIASTEPWLI